MAAAQSVEPQRIEPHSIEPHSIEPQRVERGGDGTTPPAARKPPQPIPLCAGDLGPVAGKY